MLIHRQHGITIFLFFNDTAPPEISPLSLHDALPICHVMRLLKAAAIPVVLLDRRPGEDSAHPRCDLAGIDNHRAGYLAAEHLSRLGARRIGLDRKSTRLNSSHSQISYAVFCLQQKNT